MLQPAHPATLAALPAASAVATQQTFGRLKRYTLYGRWVGATNRYAHDTIDRLNSDARSSSVNQKHLCEYIAASVPVHAMDGWTYLGKSLAAHMNGDPGTARHLAYYASLRAAMSLLASQGIGVFSGKNFVITGRNAVAQVPNTGGTHRFAWHALEWWGSQPAAAQFLGSAIRPYRQRIDQWFGALPKLSSWQPVAQQWILTLGLDLQKLADDQESRNEASYRPSQLLAPTAQLSLKDGLSFVTDLWETFEPGSGTFPALDLDLLRLSFDLAYEGVSGLRPASDPANYEAWVDDLLDANDVDDARRFILEPFMKRQSQPSDSRLISLASRHTATNEPDHHLSVISRAALLLFLASHGSRHLLETSGCGPLASEFWWPALGLERGLWSVAPERVDLIDLWEDVADSISSVDDWISSGTAGTNQRRDFLLSCSAEYVKLAQLELPGIWGVAA